MIPLNVVASDPSTCRRILEDCNFEQQLPENFRSRKINRICVHIRFSFRTATFLRLPQLATDCTASSCAVNKRMRTQNLFNFFFIQNISFHLCNSLTALPLGKRVRYPPNTELGGPHSRSPRFGAEEKFCPLWGCNDGLSVVLPPA